jgi:hypothetical protein
MLYKHHNTVVEEEKSLNSYNAKTKYYNYCSYNKLKVKSINKSKYSTKISNTNNNSYLDSYYNENNNSRMQSFKNKKYKHSYRQKKEKKINTSLKKNDKKIFQTNNHSLCQSKNSIVENSLSRKIISFNNLYNSIQNKYKESQEKKNFDTIYNPNEGKVSKSKSIFSSKEFINKTINTKSNNRSKKLLKNKRNILNSDERRKKTFHNSIKNNNENSKNNYNSNNKNVQTVPNYLFKKVKVKSKNNSMSNSINNSKLNIFGYETHNSKKFFVDETKNNNYNTNNSSNCKKLPVKNKKKKIASKNVFYQNKNKMCYRVSRSGEVVIIYLKNCNCENGVPLMAKNT